MEAKDLMKEFLENLERMGSRLTQEDLEIARESVGLFAEFERKRQAEREHRERLGGADPSSDVQGGGQTELSLDWDDYAEENAERTFAESVADGLIYSLNDRQCVDIEYIASITGRSPEGVIKELRGAVYQDPELWGEDPYGGWVTADEYLSGNLLAKLRAAETASKSHRVRFRANCEALRKLLPEAVASSDIYATLGSPWIPPDVIDAFIDHLMRGRRKYSDANHVRYDDVTGIWEVPCKGVYRYVTEYQRDNSLYSTRRIGMLTLLEHTLNVKTVAIYDTESCAKTKSGTRQVLNQKETLLALEKQKQLVEEFQKWVWKDASRKERLRTIYETRYGAIRRRVFDGSFLRFPEMSPEVTLFPHQRNAIARIIFSPNTLLAHDVGAGKTYAMIAAGMEMRRVGTSKKNMYVVPNHLVGQWRDAFIKLYPQANLLCVEPKTFSKSKRYDTLCKIRDEDFDAILIAYSCFDRIPMSAAFYQEDYNRELAALQSSKSVFESKGVIERKIKALLHKLEEEKAMLKDAILGVAFDDLGINTLFVDEADHYKNVPLDTKVTGVMGIASKGSEKCKLMMEKVKCVQRNNNGRGVVMATGTPITNSITDIFVMQKYLQPGELAMMGIGNFDTWIGMFAEKSANVEVDVDTGSYRIATRFSEFHNLPELTAILSSIADFHCVENEGLPEFQGYTECVLAPTAPFREYLKEISHRAEAVRGRAVPRNEDNMLKITTDGRKAALDLRLVDEDAVYTESSKVFFCAKNVYSIYERTRERRGTQIVFCDISTPKDGFNIYDELARLLRGMGVPACEIAYIHDAVTEKQRSALFESVCRGEVRVLIGSTFKLGIGVNVQERLTAIHHLDVPWRPADMVQREGRILRRGNTSDAVAIYRYVTEGSFDAYSWQLLETKQRFISSLLSGAMDKRSESDVDSVVLNYSEVKAIAVGNPLFKERVEVSNTLGRLGLLQKALNERCEGMRRELAAMPERIEEQRKRISACIRDIAYYTEHKRPLEKAAAKEMRERIDTALRVCAEKPIRTEIAVYQGFRVVIPAGMSAEKPCVRLEREGVYYLDMGESERGVTRRLDYFLDHFNKHFEALNQGLMNCFAREEELKRSLAESVDGYAAEIEKCKRRLKKLDKALDLDEK